MAGEEPFYAEHIDGGAEGAIAKTIFADSANTGAVVDRHFCETEATAFDERGDEAVHAPEQEQAVPAGGAHHLERTSGVAHAVASETAAHEVGDAALETLEGGVLALGTVAADEVIAFLQLLEHGRDVGGVVLQIPIQ